MSLKFIKALVLASGVMLLAAGFTNSDLTKSLLILVGYSLVFGSVWIGDSD